MRKSIACVVVLVCACGPAIPNGNGNDDSSDAGGGGGGGGSGGGGGESFADAAVCSKMDVLFVIDNSGSMSEEQTNLIANFPQFINVLDQSGLDYRIAVTTTARDVAFTVSLPGGSTTTLSAMGENGTMLKKGSMTKRWIDKSDPNVASTFSTLANVGTTGSGFEMPLATMRDAFERRMTDGTNVGFRRSDALLGIVILTDENDCSYPQQNVMLTDLGQICTAQMTMPASYKQFLDTYTGDPTRWAAAIIAGAGPGDCSSNFGTANEATRLKEFQQAVGTNAIVSSICDGDLSVGLMKATMLFKTACDVIIL